MTKRSFQDSSPDTIEDKPNPQLDERQDPEVSVDPQSEVKGTLEETTAEPTQQSPLEDAIDRGIAAWLAARLSNSPLSRTTEAWNVLMKERDSLKAFIMKEVH
ncbi:hypothetical protein STRZYGA_00770 [Brevundimonas phage vB_BpoS-Strzyga]|nr:hypothetical protein POLEWNIK_00490 [Brevundimonas phage vB_BpoS-Polewnik]USN16798.1 hypothetical protein STRZYGA_00770 [Brevundimonas phage vB_BpoS-Strzyga]